MKYSQITTFSFILLFFSNTVIGAGTEGNEATLLGIGAGANLTGTAINNTFIGHSAGGSTTDGSRNAFVGEAAGFQNTTGSRNTFIGEDAGATNTTGGNNTFVGENAGLRQTTANDNTFVGQDAGRETTTGIDNTYIGKWAGRLSTTGFNNTFVGENSGSSNNLGNNNSFFGKDSGLNNTTGGGNTFVGVSAGESKITGLNNTHIGFNSGSTSTIGSQNTLIGYWAGAGTNGSFNVFIGSEAGRNENSSNKLFIENSAISAPLIYGEFDNDIIGINGNLGVGTQMPSSALHVRRADGSAQALIEETSTTTSPRTLLNMQNNGRPEIVMGNTGTNGEWSFGAGTNFILKQGAVGSTSAAKTKHLTLFAATGNLEITGSIITGGPSCGSGCDAVFTEEYKLPSISEHAKQMYSLGYLPNVGPTIPGQSINLTDHIGKLLNELEHAHIYIAQLEEARGHQESEISQYKDSLQQLTERLERIESILK